MSAKVKQFHAVYNQREKNSIKVHANYYQQLDADFSSDVIAEATGGGRGRKSKLRRSIPPWS